MESDRFDALTRHVPAAGSRRMALVAALGGSLAALGLRDTGAKKKNTKKKKKTTTMPTTSTTCTCPPPPAPPPATFCAGKNHCAAWASCSTQFKEACDCLVRQDDLTSFCGEGAYEAHEDCSYCTNDEICVIFGGLCGWGFGCAIPCRNPGTM